MKEALLCTDTQFSVTLTYCVISTVKSPRNSLHALPLYAHTHFAINACDFKDKDYVDIVSLNTNTKLSLEVVCNCMADVS